MGTTATECLRITDGTRPGIVVVLTGYCTANPWTTGEAAGRRRGPGKLPCTGARYKVYTYREVSRENEVILKPHHVRRASVMHLKVMRGVGEGRGGLSRKISPTVGRKDSVGLAAKKGRIEEGERTETSPTKEQRVMEEKKVSWEADLEEECPSSATSSSSSSSL